MSAPFEIRPATVADVEALDRFLEPFIAQERLLPRTHDELGELAKAGFLAIVDGEIAGFAALEVYSSKLAEIRSLAVDPRHQRHGIGRALVQACIDRARERKVFEIMAVTSTEEFFQRCGFDFTLPGEKKALFLQTREKY
ncbi:MAG: N-acetylglutamate synthase [Planctomycetales bacterium 12-60-4]|nr:MAG: N-acetylglutamate synthase [Planctomycetales bacterium 12-60-4]